MQVLNNHERNCASACLGIRWRNCQCSLWCQDTSAATRVGQGSMYGSGLGVGHKLLCCLGDTGACTCIDAWSLVPQIAVQVFLEELLFWGGKSGYQKMPAGRSF